MTFVARGTRYFRRSSNDAFKLLSMSRGYDGVDLNRVMAHIGVDKMPKGSEIISEGKLGKITYQEMLDGLVELDVNTVDPLWCSRGDWFVLGREVMTVWGQRWPETYQLTWRPTDGAVPADGNSLRQPLLF